jgi:amino acid permease
MPRWEGPPAGHELQHGLLQSAAKKTGGSGGGSSGSGGGGGGVDTATTDTGATVLQTALNLANGLEGMGLLALPYTVALAGGLAFPIILLVALLTGYSACAIIASLYSRPAAGATATASAGERRGGEWQRVRSSYQEIGTAAFGAAGGRGVQVVQLLVLLAVAALFLVLIGNTLAGVVPGGVSAQLGNRGWTVVVWLAVGPSAWIPSLRQISGLSGAGVALLGGLLASLVYAACVASTAHVDGHHDGRSGGGSASAAGREVDGSDEVRGIWAARVSELPVAAQAWGSAPCVFGMVLFSFSCHTMLPAMEAGMRPTQRRLFPAVVVATFACCTVLKALFMGAGWLAFGRLTPPVVSGAFPSFLRSMLTEICLCHACSVKRLRVETPGQAITALEPVELQLVATLLVTLNTGLTLPMILFILVEVVLSSALSLNSNDGGAESSEEAIPHERPMMRCVAWSLGSMHSRRVAVLFAILGLILAVPVYYALSFSVVSVALHALTVPAYDKGALPITLLRWDALVPSCVWQG